MWAGPLSLRKVVQREARSVIIGFPDYKSPVTRLSSLITHLNFADHCTRPFFGAFDFPFLQRSFGIKHDKALYG